LRAELLEKYKGAIVKRREAETELNEQLQNQLAPDMKVKHRECKETEEQLKQVETRLGNLQSRLAISICPVQSPGCSAPLIRFLISALIIVCLFLSYASPLILFTSLFLTYLLSYLLVCVLVSFCEAPVALFSPDAVYW